MSSWGDLVKKSTKERFYEHPDAAVLEVSSFLGGDIKGKLEFLYRKDNNVAEYCISLSIMMEKITFGVSFGGDFGGSLFFCKISGGNALLALLDGKLPNLKFPENLRGKSVWGTEGTIIWRKEKLSLKLGLVFGETLLKARTSRDSVDDAWKFPFNSWLAKGRFILKQDGLKGMILKGEVDFCFGSNEDVIVVSLGAKCKCKSSEWSISGILEMSQLRKLVGAAEDNLKELVLDKCKGKLANLKVEVKFSVVKSANKSSATKKFKFRFEQTLDWIKSEVFKDSPELADRIAPYLVGPKLGAEHLVGLKLGAEFVLSNKKLSAMFFAGFGRRLKNCYELQLEGGIVVGKNPLARIKLKGTLIPLINWIKDKFSKNLSFAGCTELLDKSVEGSQRMLVTALLIIGKEKVGFVLKLRSSFCMEIGIFTVMLSEFAVSLGYGINEEEKDGDVVCLDEGSVGFALKGKGKIVIANKYELTISAVVKPSKVKGEIKFQSNHGGEIIKCYEVTGKGKFSKDEISAKIGGTVFFNREKYGALPEKAGLEGMISIEHGEPKFSFEFALTKFDPFDIWRRQLKEKGEALCGLLPKFEFKSLKVKLEVGIGIVIEFEALIDLKRDDKDIINTAFYKVNWSDQDLQKVAGSYKGKIGSDYFLAVSGDGRLRNATESDEWTKQPRVYIHGSGYQIIGDSHGFSLQRCSNCVFVQCTGS